ncbi:hypothetical protein CN918_27965 [Priestia megaterium]|nr:hypothetical protein CN918_27965 [Priestia megaterium]
MSKTPTKPKNKSKRIANISLGLMGAGFLTTLPFEPSTSLRILQGGFEAGLVGGLADWFAVTALFRHPLNIPIPHTALLPNNREKITNTILHIVQTEWLKKETIQEKVKNIHTSQLVLSKLEVELQKDSAKKHIKQALQTCISYIEIDKIETLTKTAFTQISAHVDTKQALSFAVDKSLEYQLDEKVYGLVYQVLEKKILDKQTKDAITAFLLQTIEKKAENSFFKLALKPLVSVGREKLTSTLHKAIDDIMADLKDENSENRMKIIHYIQQELKGLKHNEEIIAQLSQRKDDFFTSEPFTNANAHVADLLFTKVKELTESDVFVESKVIPFILSLIQKLQRDTELMNTLDERIKTALITFIEQNHSKIGQLVKDNINKLNNDQLIDMMENKIGKELSWIRVNGSLCGFLIGILLSTIKVIV